MMTFGQQLQYLRKQKGYSQEQLAQQLYVTRQSVMSAKRNRCFRIINYIYRIKKRRGVCSSVFALYKSVQLCVIGIIYRLELGFD